MLSHRLVTAAAAGGCRGRRCFPRGRRAGPWGGCQVFRKVPEYGARAALGAQRAHVEVEIHVHVASFHTVQQLREGGEPRQRRRSGGGRRLGGGGTAHGSWCGRLEGPNGGAVAEGGAWEEGETAHGSSHQEESSERQLWECRDGGGGEG